MPSHVHELRAQRAYVQVAVRRWAGTSIRSIKCEISGSEYLIDVTY